jgi:hypothetical protein
MEISRALVAQIALVALAVIAWLAWAWLSGGFCTPPPGSACL